MRNVFYSLLIHALLCVPFFTEKKEIKTETVPVEIQIKKVVAVKQQSGVKTSTVLKGSLFPVMSSQNLLAKVEQNSSLPTQNRNFKDTRTYQSDISDVFGEDGNKNCL